jgi:acetyltransferase-like isoleucine patch superfamily enzyme
MFKAKYCWAAFWMKLSGLSRTGRIATWLATLSVPPYRGRVLLSHLSPTGYVSIHAAIHHEDLRLGRNCFIGDRVQIDSTAEGGYVELRDKVALYSDIIIETAYGGNVTIGEETHIQARCQLVAGKSSIIVGKRVEIAPNCGIYPFNHGMEAGKRIREQPLLSKGDIIIGDDAWLGFGVVLLDGARVGKGAVIGAGSVVNRYIPDNAIAYGVPARVVGSRENIVMQL